jgi:flagellar protein FlaG
MVSEVQNISGVQRSPVPAVVKVAAAPVPATPKVVAPKPVEIQFDEVQARRNLEDAVRGLNEQMAATKTGLGFSVDKALGRPVVTVRNTETGEVVRQIPTEVVVRLAHSIDDMKGLLLNATT